MIIFTCFPLEFELANITSLFMLANLFLSINSIGQFKFYIVLINNETSKHILRE